MFRIALRSIAAKKRRLLGTAMSVLLGVAFLAGTSVFTDTIRRTFDDLFAGIYAETDTVVRAQESIDSPMSGTQRARLPESLVDVVAQVDGVADVYGGVGAFAQIVGSDGDAIGNPAQGAPTFGMSYESGPLDPWTLTEGSRAPGAGELVVDQGSADKGDLQIGDTVTVLTQTGAHQFTLVGTARFGTIDSPGGASIALFDLQTAQDVLLGGADEVDDIWVDAMAGVDEAELTRRVSAVLPDGVEAITGSQMTDETQDQLREGLSFFNTFLLVFAAIGLVVASFTIYNTFQIIVTQRTKEMALLRSIGATRRQVLGAQLLEALVLGIVASILGLFAGIGVASALQRMMDAVGIDIPAGDTVVTLRTAITAMVVGTLVTTLSAVMPSRRASRVRPLAAIRDLAAPSTGRDDRRRALEGGALLLFGLGGFVAGLTGAGLLWVGLGALVVFIGASVLGPLVALPFTRLIGRPIAAVSGVTGALARENAARNPKRTARSGGPLMIGVALVATIAIIAATAKDWTRDVFAEQFTGDYVVASDAFGLGGLGPDVAVALGALPEIDAAAGIRVGAARDVAAEDDTSYVSIDPSVAGEVFDLDMAAGTIAGLTADGILVDDDEADGRGIEVGDSLQFTFVDGTTRSLAVQGIYRKDDLAGPFVVSNALHESTGVDQYDFAVYLKSAAGTAPAAVEAAVRTVVDEFPNAELQSRDEYIADQTAQVDMIVNLMYGLLALAIVIALFSIANSIALSVHERTCEIGLLRAVGMTRHQIGSVVRWEVVIVALLGTLLGILLGICFGWAISVTLRNEGLADAVVPFTTLGLAAVAAVIGSVLAAVRPSWRAAHLDVLSAISTE